MIIKYRLWMMKFSDY